MAAWPGGLKHYLLVILDCFSRYTVGWCLAYRDTARIAERLIAETLAKQGISRDTLTIHADRGSSQASKPVAFLLADLGVTKTHSRPHTSNDNPYSEAQFKTLKYRPEFPERFRSMEEARVFCQLFFRWYNEVHRHSGIGFMTPEAVHYGRAPELTEHREEVLAAAYAAHPERFVRKPPAPPRVPTAAWINKPEHREEVVAWMRRVATASRTWQRNRHPPSGTLPRGGLLLGNRRDAVDPRLQGG